MAKCVVCGQWYSDSDYTYYNGCSDCVKRYEREGSEEAERLGLSTGLFGFDEWCHCAIIKLRDANGEIPHKVAVDQIREYAESLKRRREEAEERHRRVVQEANEQQAALDRVNLDDYYS